MLPSEDGYIWALKDVSFEVKEGEILNRAILGMRKEEIKKKFDNIVAFAYVEKFLDTPMKRYSSGMYVRLALALNIEEFNAFQIC